MRFIVRALFAFCAAAGLGCFGTIITLMAIGLALQLSHHGLSVAATIVLPLWIVALLPFGWRIGREL